MSVIHNFFSNHWADALGWTLLHSVWQSLVILLIVLACLRLIPCGRSSVRYVVACAGFFMILASAIATFTWLINRAPASAYNSGGPSYENIWMPDAPVSVSPADQILTTVTGVIESNMPLLITLWVIGFLIFSARLYNGLAYTHKLRTTSAPLYSVWDDYVQKGCAELGITRVVQLAESAAITSPMVIGYLKPIILLPTGMLTGLSTAQLETILLHELAHIKRHDFFVNLLQVCMETTFFFNPFVWILSSLIRREREYCCDDIVIMQHGGAMVYARALAKLEEARLSKEVFALSLAEDKNQLLNRIRRIMEKSVKNYPVRNRLLLPAALIVAGLLCVSLLSRSQENMTSAGSVKAKPDTVLDSVEKNIRTATFSRKRVITIDENGQPHEEIIEEFEGDESLRPLLKGDIFNTPWAGSSMPLSPLQAPSTLLPPGALTDSLPSLESQKQWEAFAKELEAQFEKRFKDFDALDLSAMMNGLREGLDSLDWPSASAFEHFGLSEEAFKEAQKAQEEALKKLEQFQDNESFKELQDRMKKTQKNLQQSHHMRMDRKVDEERFQQYEQALQEQLTKDGYLSEAESIESMEWTDDSFKVNGKPIKDSDKKKYQELHHRFLGKGKYAGKME